MNIMLISGRRRRVRRRAVATGAASLLLLAGCGSSSGSGASPGAAGSSGSATPLDVVASTNVYGDIARQVGGDKVRVTSIITDPAIDPHSYEASTQNLLQLSKADVVVENGGGYDDFVDDMLKTSKSKATVLDAVDISGRTALAGGELNEHVWYDYPSMQKLTDELVGALSAADAADTAVFRSGGDQFKQKLQQLEGTEASIRSAHTGQPVAPTEPVPLYLLEACGLQNRTPAEFSEAIEEGGDVPAAVLQETMDLFTNKQVKLLAYNSQTSGRETEKVLDAARSNGIAVVPVTESLPAGQDYVSWMSGTLAAVQSALG